LKFCRPIVPGLITVLLLAGCSLSPRKVEDVDSRVEHHRDSALTCPANTPYRCAIPSPLLELGRENLDAGRHHLTLIEYGEDALKLRLHLVRAAQRSVDVQNFILRKDQTGELFLDELLKAARRGVKVRLLLDQMFSFSDVEYLVSLVMEHRNLEIRFYNPTFHKAKMAKHDWLTGLACCFRGVNQRMHNKLQVVDGLVGITGGRNIADRYFDHDSNYEFKDRDVAVFGPEVGAMAESFEWFWNAPKTEPVQHLRDVASELLNNGATRRAPYSPPPRLRPVLEGLDDPAWMKAMFVDTAYPVRAVDYFSDRPRDQETPGGDPSEDITGKLHGILVSARHSVLIQSPYMVLSRRARHLFEKLRKDNPDLELVFSTNSLASTDADTVYANTHRHKRRYVRDLGFRMYEFKPFPDDAADFFPRWPLLIEEKELGIGGASSVSGDDSTIPMPSPRVGLHSKSFVVDGRVAMIGSHNFDPRSEGFNTENGLIVWDEAFAGELERLIRRDIRPGNSWVVAVKPDEEEQKTALGRAPWAVSEFTPWPSGDTSVYELAPGMEPVPPESPEFYRRYYDVGNFPEVVRTRRQLTVLFLGSFFFFLEPIL
jgi:putative cardiolipin synthase